MDGKHAIFLSVCHKKEHSFEYFIAITYFKENVGSDITFYYIKVSILRSCDRSHDINTTWLLPGNIFIVISVRARWNMAQIVSKLAEVLLWQLGPNYREFLWENSWLRQKRTCVRSQLTLYIIIEWADIIFSNMMTMKRSPLKVFCRIAKRFRRMEWYCPSVRQSVSLSVCLSDVNISVW